jgi:hypothetical protein
MVGMVVTISPSLSLYRMVVLPAASRPTEIHERVHDETGENRQTDRQTDRQTYRHIGEDG